MSNLTIPKSSPILVGNSSARYLHTGDLFVQVFPRMNPQVPVKVLVLMLSPISRSIIIAIITSINHGTSDYVSHCFVPNIFIKLYRQHPQASIISSYMIIEEQHQ